MKAFTIDSERNITACASQQEAAAAQGDTQAFATAAGLQGILKKLPATTAVEIWNGMSGVTPVKKFTNGTIAAKRIFAQLQKLGGPAEATETAPAVKAAGHAPKDKDKPLKATKAPKAAKKAKARKPAGSGPRETSKTAQLIEMLKRPGGATLEEVMARFGWQVHTTRALMSAGGSLTKKHGITVISEKVGDSRTYRIAR
jgi:Protein of unknown function (DUF3489)